MSLDKLKESTTILHNPITNIKQEYLDAQEEYWKAWKKIITSDYDEYEKQIAPYYNKVMEKHRNFRMVQSPKLGSIPNYGSLMTIKHFIDCVNDGGFIDYDGHGNYSDGENMTDIHIYPSDVKYKSIRKEFSHVVWFNK